MKKGFSLLGIIFLLSLAGCSTTGRFAQDGPPAYNVDVSRIGNAVPKAETRSRYGNPRDYVVRGRRYHVMASAKGYCERGIASWYGSKFHSRLTSNRERYNMLAMTAAHKTLPLPTYVRVTNLKNNLSIIVRVNDRGPFAENRIIDLSYVAAKKLGMLPTGTALVEVSAIDAANPETYMKPKAEFTRTHPPGIYLQVGAYANVANANNQYRLLKQKLPHYGIVLRQDEKAGQALYRVQIGPLPNVEHTDVITEKLHHLGFMQTVVVIK